jgi:hypothetical protein
VGDVVTRVHLGYLNVPYTEQSIIRPVTSAKEEARRSRKRSFRTTMTTEKVGEILEEHYGLLDVFWELQEKDVVNILKTTITNRVQGMMAGRSPIRDRSITGVAKPAFKGIEKLFRDFLDRKVMDGLVPGVPTKASLKGTTGGRYKTLRPGRPSFVATGLLRASFRVWIT